MILSRFLVLLCAPLALAQDGPTSQAAENLASMPGFVASIDPATEQPRESVGLTEMIVFGSSSADSGNVFALTGGAIPPSPPYYAGRFTNGPNWVDRLAVHLALPVPGPFFSPLGGTNFAVGGAQTGQGLSSACVGNTCAPNIGLQIELFLAESPVIDGDELFVLEGGGNDFAQFTGLSNATKAADNMRANIETLALAGAENFVVNNLRRPYPTGVPFEPSNNVWILLFNQKLEQHLQQLESELGLTIVRVDLYALHSAMLSDPGAFGLTNLLDPACPPCAGMVGPIASNPDEFFYWDGAHYTTAIHAFVAEIAADGVNTALGLGL